MAVTEAVRRSPSSALRGERAQRVDIQSLRGIAVLAVVVYHLWPGALPGGYVGVDVFFVISGFLITSQLLRELDETGRIRLSLFWARRARRLLPAALLVAAAALVGTLILVPASAWPPFLREIAAAVLYVENWALAIDSVDYLAAENSASPVQHYWSLSVEEQFYLVWPLLVLGAALLPWGGAASRRWRVGIAIGLVTAGSLLGSILLTSADPGLAYFGTHVRAWQFGAGGILALAVPVVMKLGRSVRLGALGLGIAAIVASSLVFTAATPFPGWAALLPTGGAVLVLLAGTGSAAAVTRWGRYLLLDRLGNISYAVYLWHWPLIVILDRANPAELGALELSAIGVASILLGWVTTRFVDQPVRAIRLDGTRRRSAAVLIASVAAMALLVVPALAIRAAQADAGAQAIVSAHDQVTEAETAAPDAPVDCMGAQVRNPSLNCAPLDPHAALIPDPSYAADDLGRSYLDGCNVGVRDPEIDVCHYGPDDAETRVALIGDSHANHWFPAVEAMAETEGWRLTTLLHSACPEATGSKSPACDGWRANMRDAPLDYGPFDLVFVSYSRSGNATLSEEEAVEGFVGAWQKYIDTGATIVVIEDVPRATSSTLECLIERAPEDCRTDPDESNARPDYMVAAAESLPSGAVVLETHDIFCQADACDTAIGGVVVYRDEHHLTATFALSAAPLLRDRLAEELGELP